MKRRTFITTSSAAIIGSAASTVSSDGALGARYNLQVPDVTVEPKEDLNLSISFAKLELNPIGIDTSKDLSMTVKVAIDDNDLKEVDEKTYSGSKLGSGGDISDVINNNKPSITNNPSDGTNPVLEVINSKNGYNRVNREMHVRLTIEWDSVTARSEREVSDLTIKRETLPSRSDVTNDFTTTQASIDSSSKPEIKLQVKTDGLDVEGDLSKSDFKIGEKVGDGEFRATEITDFGIAGESSSLAPDVFLVIDKSGSMGGVLNDVQNAATSLVDKLASEVRIGVIVFESSASVIKQLTTNHQNVKEKINGISDDGGTDMNSGMTKAGSNLKNNARDNSRNFVVGLSDGDVNYSYNSNDFPDGTGVMGIAYGSNAQSVDSVAHNPDGSDDNYAFRGGTDEIDRIFDEITQVIDSFYEVNYNVNVESSGSRDYRVYIDKDGKRSILEGSYNY